MEKLTIKNIVQINVQVPGHIKREFHQQCVARGMSLREGVQLAMSEKLSKWKVS